MKVREMLVASARILIIVSVVNIVTMTEWALYVFLVSPNSDPATQGLTAFGLVMTWVVFMFAWTTWNISKGIRDAS